MWFHAQRHPGGDCDLVQLVVTLPEQVDAAALRTAWAGAQRRHEALRTRLVWENRLEPAQEVVDTAPLDWREEDWCGRTAAQRATDWADWLAQDRRTGLALDRAPLWRVTLLHWTPTEWRLVWTLHHTIADGRSFVVVLREVFDDYAARRAGQTVSWPPAPQFRDYMAWRETQATTGMEAYWRQMLAGFTTPTPLPGTPAGAPETAGEKIDLEEFLSPETTAALTALADRAAVTLSTLVQGAWALLLERQGGGADVVFGATRACRHGHVDGATGMVGLLINTLPFRVRIDPEAMLIPWLQGLRRQWVELRPHEHAALLEVQRWSEVPRGHALMESLVVYETQTVADALRAQRQAWRSRDVTLVERSNFPLTLAVHGGERLLLKLGGLRPWYDEAGLRRLLGHVRTLLESFATSPDQPLREFSLLSAAERQELLVGFNDTFKAYPLTGGVHHLVERQAARTPDRVAVRQGGSAWSYRELNDAANGLAEQLRTRGVARGQFVPLLLAADPALLAAELAVLKCGAAFVPLDPAWPAARLTAVLAELSAPVLVGAATAPTPELPAGTAWLPVEFAALPRVARNPDPVTDPDDPIYAMFTSGSTGRPRAAVNHHRGILNRLFNMNDRYGASADEIVLATTAPVFDSSVWQYFWPLMNGGCTVLPTTGSARDPLALVDLLANARVTFTDFSPGLLSAVVRQLEHDPATAGRLAALRHVIIGGDELQPAVVARGQELLPHTGFTNAYGPTETSIGVIFHAIGRPPADPLPIGRPLHNVLAVIVDDAGRPVPVGVTGQLWLGGACVGHGYLHQPEATRAAFRPNPFPELACPRWYQTGDRARRLPHGEIVFAGRVDHQVKIRGFRVEPGEIEAALRAQPGVREAVVVARPDASGQKQLTAYVVGQPGVPLRAAELAGALRAKLPEHMVPAHLVDLPALPLTGLGKVDRQALPPPPEPRREAPSGGRPDPPDLLSCELTRLWEQVFQRAPIGPEEDFFALGGHSLLATTLTLQLERLIGRRLPPGVLFQAPTIAALARRLRADRSAPAWSALVPLRATGGRPPLFLVHGLHGDLFGFVSLVRHMVSDRPVYGLQLNDPAALPTGEATLESLAARHADEIQARCPRGPCHLVGYSQGGWMAFAVAQELRRRGQGPVMLSVLDTRPTCDIPRPLFLRVMSLYFLRRVPLHLGRALRGPAGGPLAYLGSRWRWLCRHLTRARRREILDPDGENSPGVRPADAFERAAAAYRPGRYAGDLTVLAVDRHFGFPHRMFWRHYVAGEIRVRAIPGIHDNLIQEAQLAGFVPVFERALAEAEERLGGGDVGRS